MSIATEVSAAQFNNIVVNVPLNNNYPLFAIDEVEVVYGSQAIVATLGLDYSVQLSAPNYNSFTITPLAPLLTKINALIAVPPTDAAETNYVVVRRRLDNTTSVTDEIIKDVPFLVRELDRMAMRFIQIQEQVDRQLGVPANLIGDPLNQYTISPPVEGKAPVWRGNKLVAEIDAGDIADAQDSAADATAAAVAAAALLVQMNDLLADMQALAAALPLNNFAATTNPTVNDDANDGYSSGSEWINVTTGDRFSCSNAAVGAAVWTEVSADLSGLGDMAYEDKDDYLLLADFDVDEIRMIPITDKSGNYTVAAADGGGTLNHPATDATARTFTIPRNANVAIPRGKAITMTVEPGAGVINIVMDTTGGVADTLYWVGQGVTGNRSLAAGAQVTIYKVNTTLWFISGSGIS